MKILIFGGGSDMTPAIQRIYPDAIAVPHEECDVVSYADVDATLTKHKPDIVINLAGISNIHTVDGSDTFDWWDEIEVNLVGSYLVARQSIEHGVNKMIFMGSVAGLYGKPTHSGYSASKAGVISLVQSLAMEGHNAYVISPGRVNTKLREKDFPGEDIKTRLTVDQIAEVMQEIIEDKHQPGDNLIIRKIGYETFRLVDKGEPWKEYLNVGGEVFK